MESLDKAHEPAPNVLLGFTLAAGLSVAMWGLLYLGVASVWPRQVNRPDVAVEGQAVPHLASLANQPRAHLPTRTRVKTARKRRRGPSMVARIFNPSTSLN
jgi:hypothetical protein